MLDFLIKQKLAKFERLRMLVLLKIKSVPLKSLIDNPKLITDKPGIYVMFNTVNYKPYIGESVNVSRRLIQHALVQYPTQYVDRDIKRLGVEKFRVAFLENVSNLKKRRIIEGKYVELFNSYYNGYNGSKNGNPTTAFYRFWKKIMKKILRTLVPHYVKQKRKRNKYKNYKKLKKYYKFLK